MSDTKAKVIEIYSKLTEEEKKVFVKVLKAEKEKIHMQRADGIYEDIEKIIREEIK